MLNTVFVRHGALASILALVCCVALRAETLSGRHLTATLDAANGALTGLTNGLTEETFAVNDRGVEFQTSAGTFRSAAGDKAEEGVTTLPGARIDVAYRIAPGQDFFEKIVTLTNTGAEPLTIHKVTPADYVFKPRVLEIAPHRDPNVLNKLINLFLKTEKGGFYCGVQNPIFEFWTRGQEQASTSLTITFQPNWQLKPGESFTSDPFYLGAYRNEGIYCFRELGKLGTAVAGKKLNGTFLNTTQDILDWGQVWAMSAFMRAIMPAHDARDPGFYVRGVAMVGGSTTETWGDDAAFHIEFEEKHVAGSKRFIDQVEKLGHIPHVEWATEWFGVGGYTNPTRDLMLEKPGPGDPVPVNPYWQEVVDYGRSKGIYPSVFETVVRDFAMDRPDFKVTKVDGQPWLWQEKPPQPINCWANDAYVDWRLQVTDQAVKDQELYMFAWDSATPAYWTSHGFPETQTECYNPQHSHLPGPIEYKIFRNIMRFLDELQTLHPRLSLRVACGATTAYPWVLKHLIEYHPNLYDGETGSTYWMSYNYRFLPIYKSGLLLSATTKENFEYLLLRSIANSDHFMLWPDAIPIALENKGFWDEWLKWADANIEYLRAGRTLFREPWGDEIVASLPPALEGGLPSEHGSIHGVSHCLEQDGFVFLFNPTDAPRVAEVPVGDWLGLTGGERFDVAAMYPVTLKLEGVAERGSALRVPVAPRQAVVLRLAATEQQGRAPAAALPDGAPVDKAFLTWNEIPWGEIMAVPGSPR